MKTQASQRLAVYGTLAPGRPNEHQLFGLTGTWTKGIVRGHLKPAGWGAAQGYPGLTLDPNGPDVPVQLFESGDLPAHWDRLDRFEGEDYRRIEVDVEIAGEPPRRAMIYAVGPHAPNHQGHDQT